MANALFLERFYSLPWLVRGKLTDVGLGTSRVHRWEHLADSREGVEAFITQLQVDPNICNMSDLGDQLWSVITAASRASRDVAEESVRKDEEMRSGAFSPTLTLAVTQAAREHVVGVGVEEFEAEPSAAPISSEPPVSMAGGIFPAGQNPNTSWLARVIWELAGERHPVNHIHGRRRRTFREGRSQIILSSNRNQVTPYDLGHYLGLNKFVGDLPGLMNLCLLGKRLAVAAVKTPRAKRSRRRNMHLIIFRSLKIIHLFLGNDSGVAAPLGDVALRRDDRRLVPTGRPPPYDAPWPTSPLLLRRLGIERLLTSIAE